MSALVNTIGITLGLGALGLGGWGMVVLINKEPTAYTLASKAEGITLTNYTSNTTIGGITENQKVLVADIANNQNWFNWVYKNLLETKKTETNSNIDSGFSSVDHGYGTDETKSLNKVCDTFYKKTKTDFDNDTNNNKLNNIKFFCTFGGNKEVKKPQQ